ncbi:MAG: hypothetical protein NTZ80_03820, partial [Patescibacteria group bacterium]|nr:hypothetical protein [Patescibacteria group bacterium]
IGIKNPRTQRLKDLEEEKRIFIDFYNSIYKISNESVEETIAKFRKNHIDSDYIIILARNTNALSQDGLKFVDFSVKKNIRDPLWKNYGQIVKSLASHRDAVIVRRFRRIIPVERIVKLADMLYSLPSMK